MIISGVFAHFDFPFVGYKKKGKQRNQIILSRSIIKMSLGSSTFKLPLSLSTSSSSSFSSPRARRTCISSARTRSRYSLPSRSGIRTTLTAFISRTLLGCISLFPWRICGPAGGPPATCWLTSTRCALSSNFQPLTSYFLHIQALSPPKKPLKIIAQRHQSRGFVSQVEGINGMYLANKLVDEHVKTFITYNKGQTWALLPAPPTDVAGNNLNCILVSGADGIPEQ